MTKHEALGNTGRMVTKTPPSEAAKKPSKADARQAEIERSIAAHLLGRFGPVVTLAQVAEVLAYPSADALERSVQRGHIELLTLKLPHRRGTFVLAHDLAHHLAVAEREVRLGVEFAVGRPGGSTEKGA